MTLEQLFQKDFPLASLTSFKTGGRAQFYGLPADIEEVKNMLSLATRYGLALTFLGGGTNVLVSDKGVDGIVLHTAGLKGIERQGNELTILAGTPVNEVTSYASLHGLKGMEFAGGLPGTIGGAALMNARCYGSEMSEHVVSVRYLDPDGNSYLLSADELDYSYKNSIFQYHPDRLIVEVTLILSPGDSHNIAELTETHRRDRVNKGQFIYPSAGCAFKNNYSLGIPSGKLIEECGLKELSVGDASVLSCHGNFIINKGSASSSDIFTLITRIEEGVLEKKGIKLEKEVRLLGDFSML